MNPTSHRSRHGSSASSNEGEPPRYVDVPLIELDDAMVQGELFPLRDIEQPLRGYRGTVASNVAGITYRQLDYWARRHIVEPSITPSNGSGSRRLYSFRDVVILAVLKKLLDIGVNLHNVMTAAEFLAHQPHARLERMTILCDGERIEECPDAEHMAWMLDRGEAVFGVSVGVLWHRIEQALEREDHVDLTGAVRMDSSHAVDDPVARRLRDTLEERRMRLREVPLDL